MRNIIVLGVTGSIGSQTQEILLDNPNDFKLLGISIGNQVDIIDSILAKFPTFESVSVKNYQD